MDIIIVEFVLVAFKIIILLTGRGLGDGEGERRIWEEKCRLWQEWLEIDQFGMIIDF